ncbi:hypothetical protein DQ04_21151000 [Trypanosoma grayi]|uniref:hypothetical protein n=1 Tax=Trypanosoma grayi TaxID=71804 RepID=UPI0004F44C5C|nr:hypothetical protein DQ04_21151000 [Trypanosoma grayi]KEG05509.1 hypothetical protein DQ04_21151000 [Trypanosoma grayi]
MSLVAARCGSNALESPSTIRARSTPGRSLQSACAAPPSPSSAWVPNGDAQQQQQQQEPSLPNSLTKRPTPRNAARDGVANTSTATRVPPMQDLSLLSRRTQTPRAPRRTTSVRRQQQQQQQTPRSARTPRAGSASVGAPMLVITPGGRRRLVQPERL